jgi:hypothetical protein
MTATGEMILTNPDEAIPARARFDDFVAKTLPTTMDLSVQNMFELMQQSGTSYASAAQTIVNELKVKSAPLFEGEPAGATPFSYYRLDRIHGIEELTGEAAVPLKDLLPNGEEGLRNYIEENIYATSGKRVMIELEGSDEMTDTVLDAFGDNAAIKPTADGNIHVRIKTNENKGLYRWLMQYAGSLKVISPEHIRDGVKERLKAALEVCEGEHDFYRNQPPFII